jgi:phytoene dehydrogenase-like protein
VIGAGPNGLVCAAYLARAGWSVEVLERADEPGGAVRSEALTLPGFVHDTFSAFYGLLHASPVFRELELDRRVRWRHFATPVAAVVAPDRVALIVSDVDATARGLAAADPADGAAWRDLYEWWQDKGERLFGMLLAPVGAVKPVLRFARAARFWGSLETALMQMTRLEDLARDRFSSEEARALFASGVTHSELAVDEVGSAPPAIVLAMLAQAYGMPVPAGGASKLADGLVGAVAEGGGSIRTGAEVTRVVVERGRAVGVEVADGGVIRARRAVIADTGPLALTRDLVGEAHFPQLWLAGLRRFRYGAGVFKLDLALSGPVPWKAEGVAESGVVHLCGDLDTMARSAFEVRRGLLPQEPLLVVGQQSVADETRAPQGAHTLWIECHVPSAPPGGTWDTANGETFAERVMDRLERHAPGLRQLVLASAIHTPADLERANPNLVGGDVGGGSNSIDHQLIFRPIPGWFRYRTPVKGLYLCSASTHPGGGVHGMCGRNAAQRVLRDSRPWRVR